MAICTTGLRGRMSLRFGRLGRGGRGLCLGTDRDSRSSNKHPMSVRPNSFELYFEDDDPASIVDKARAAGLEFIHDIVEQPWQQRVVRFYDSRAFRAALLNGTMEVLHDSASKELIWRTGDEMYYPKGVNDPDYCVLRFTATSGRYYANFTSVDFEPE